MHVRRKHSQEDEEWITNVYEDVVKDRQIVAMTGQIAEAMRGPDDPPITFAHIMAARRYLLTCLLNMSTTEVGGLSAADCAGLWAAGALGAARYRSRGRRARRSKVSAGGGEHEDE